jgi:GMP synthase (glutamine-hydrolysing)
MSTLIINSAEPDERRFVEPIERFLENQGTAFETRGWRDFLEVKILEMHESVIISASPMGDNANFNERIMAFQWVKKAAMPVMGICAGHQFIGHVFGAKLIRDRESEKGNIPVTIVEDDPVFEGLGPMIETEQQHHDSITLPENFRLLASSDQCLVQAIRHAEKPIYGFQWHVEISNLAIIGNFIRL